MNQYQTSAEIKNTARAMLDGKYGISVPAGLFKPLSSILLQLPFLFIIVIIFTMIELSSGTPVSDVAITLTERIIKFPCSIVSGIFQTGLCLYFLNIACGKRHSLSDMFFGFRWQFQKSLALSAIFATINVLCFLPHTILVSQMELPYTIEKMLLIILAFLGGTVLQLPFQLIFAQTFYLLLDFPQMSTMQLLKQSCRLMKGHKKRLLHLWLSFLPLEFLCVCSCFIGYLWLIPYQNMSYALFYLDLMKPQKT